MNLDMRGVFIALIIVTLTFAKGMAGHYLR
jgi:hypothetical protein